MEKCPFTSAANDLYHDIERRDSRVSLPWFPFSFASGIGALRRKLWEDEVGFNIKGDVDTGIVCLGLADRSLNMLYGSGAMQHYHSRSPRCPIALLRRRAYTEGMARPAARGKVPGFDGCPSFTSAGDLSVGQLAARDRTMP